MAEELAIKRLRYFNHQFLRVEDFQEEQDYHLRMRRRLNRVLHTWGVAEGLAVTAAAGATSVKVAPGTAIDEQGREIVLLTERVEPLGTYTTKTVFVTLRYLEEPTDETDETGTGQEARRWTERAEVRIVGAAPAKQGDVLLLARVNLAANGTVASVDEGDVAARRRYAGVVGGDLEVRSLALASEGRPAAEYPLFRWGAANRADLTGSLRVTQNAAVEGSFSVAGTSTLGGRVAIGIGATAPKTALHVPESGLQIGASSTVANNFHFVSDEVPTGAPRALRLYGGNYGSGSHLLSVTAAGRVGIGITDPGAPLHVRGRVISHALAGFPGGFSLIPNDPSAWFHIDHPGGNRMRFSHGGEPGGAELMTITGGGSVGIGTAAPEARFHVTGGAIMPAVGNSKEAGIMFPENPGQGGGDAAWIRYYARTGENTTLEIGIANDADDHISLMASGTVGIGTTTPQGGKLDVAGDVLMGGGKGSKFTFHTRTHAGGDILYIAPDDAAGNWQWGRALMYRRTTGNFGIGGVDPVDDRLTVAGSLRILTDGNPIRFTSRWSGHADATKAEISNDTTGDKKLMIVGNSSAGGVRRVGVWDELAVHGRLLVDSDIVIAGDKQFYSSGRIHFHGAERVYFLNKQGVFISKGWEGNGNLSVDGNVGIGTETPGYRLHVMGGARIQGNLSVDGSKYGYVVDEFVNTTGDVLEQGDVVVIGANQESQYLNAAGRIPIPEVDLTDREHDTRVCGVVAEISSFAERNGDADPTATEVQPGQVGAMVTLGAFVVCKVDADYGAIQVGDLLTTSATRGHARRVDDPARAAGAIVGKALASLEAGRGKIPVLVTLH